MSNWAVVENNAITEYYDNLPLNWRNISNFSSLLGDTSSLQSFGWYPVNNTTQPLDNSGAQSYGPVSYTFDPANLVVIQNEPIIQGEAPDPAVVFAAQRASFMDYLRSQRDAMITACDWVMMPDVQVLPSMTDAVKASWIAYRTALRNLPEVYNSQYPTMVDTAQIVFPISPGG
jgi:hypothetical protein